MKSHRSNYKLEKSDRLEARLSRQQKELIQHAADLVGRSLTDFILRASQEAANKVIREHKVITLTAQESENFVNTLMNPPEPNPFLKKAVKRHRKFFNEYKYKN
jgi:uncharacterized protein (DUF1778 family)